MGIFEIERDELLDLTIIAKTKKRKWKRNKEAHTETLPNEGQLRTEQQEVKRPEEERAPSEISGQDGIYTNAIPREKRNKVMAVDPRALLQQYDAGPVNEVSDTSLLTEASSSDATLTTTNSATTT